MMQPKTIGRVVAALFLTQAAFGPLANFVLPGAAAALVLFLTGLVWLGVAITVHPLLRQHSEAAALGFFALAIACFCGLIVEGVTLHAAMPPLRRPAHYMALMLGGVAYLVFYGALLRFALIPRVLAAFGAITAALVIAGALIPWLGSPNIMAFFMPIGLSQLAVIVWLAIKGFDSRQGVRAS
jgi:hypothetical protein